MPQVGNLPVKEHTFGCLKLQIVHLKSLEHRFQVLNVFLKGGGKDDNVIHVDETVPQAHLSHTPLHKFLECSRRITETKRQLVKLKKSQVSLP